MNKSIRAMCSNLKVLLKKNQIKTLDDFEDHLKVWVVLVVWWIRPYVFFETIPLTEVRRVWLPTKGPYFSGPHGLPSQQDVAEQAGLCE